MYDQAQKVLGLVDPHATTDSLLSDRGVGDFKFSRPVLIEAVDRFGEGLAGEVEPASRPGDSMLDGYCWPVIYRQIAAGLGDGYFPSEKLSWRASIAGDPHSALANYHCHLLFAPPDGELSSHGAHDEVSYCHFERAVCIVSHGEQGLAA